MDLSTFQVLARVTLPAVLHPVPTLLEVLVQPIDEVGQPGRTRLDVGHAQAGMTLEDATRDHGRHGRHHVERELDRVRPNAGLEYVQASIELPWFERDFVAAIEIWDLPEIRAFTSVDGWGGWSELVRAMAWRELGDKDRASALLAEVVDRNIDRSMAPANLGSELQARSQALALLGDFESAIAAAEEAVSLQTYESDKIEGSYPLEALCFVLALAGKRDEALAMLPSLLEMPNGFYKWQLYLDPRWDFMRDDERFNELIRPDNLEQSIHATKKKRRGPVQ